MLPLKQIGQYMTATMKTNYDWCLETYLKSKPHIKKFRTAIDVGCRDGDYSLPLVEDFEKVHAFDYRPRMKYEHKKLTYYPVALGDESTEVMATGGVIKEYGEKQVRQKKLDDYNFDEVDYLKIDVEGHELKVLKGAITTIETSSPLIVIEENGSQELYNKGVREDALFYLQKLNYKVVYRFEKPNPLDIILVR